MALGKLCTFTVVGKVSLRHVGIVLDWLAYGGRWETVTGRMIRDAMIDILLFMID